MIRIRNWDIGLRRWALQQVGKPFRWGETDCASLAIAALNCMYPKPLLKPATWTTQRAALEEMAYWPNRIMDELARLNATALRPAFGSIGDLLYLPDQPFPHLYVHLGHELLASDPELGVHRTVVARYFLERAQLIAYRVTHG